MIQPGIHVESWLFYTGGNGEITELVLSCCSSLFPPVQHGTRTHIVRMNTNVRLSIRVYLCSFVVPHLAPSLQLAAKPAAGKRFMASPDLIRLAPFGCENFAGIRRNGKSDKRMAYKRMADKRMNPGAGFARKPVKSQSRCPAAKALRGVARFGVLLFRPKGPAVYMALALQRKSALRRCHAPHSSLSRTSAPRRRVAVLSTSTRRWPRSPARQAALTEIGDCALAMVCHLHDLSIAVGGCSLRICVPVPSRTVAWNSTDSSPVTIHPQGSRTKTGTDACPPAIYFPLPWFHRDGDCGLAHCRRCCRSDGFRTGTEFCGPRNCRSLHSTCSAIAEKALPAMSQRGHHEVGDSSGSTG